jgi:hypothetical protein
MPFCIGIQCKTVSLSILDERSCHLLTATETNILQAGAVWMLIMTRFLIPAPIQRTPGELMLTL